MDSEQGTRGTVVQFGAGAIGRGFLGQLWTGGSFEVVFVDVAEALVTALNARRSYPLRLLDNDSEANLTISPVRSVPVGDDLYAKITDELAVCAFACTAVGVGQFELLGTLLAGGLQKRVSAGVTAPLNILCCENQPGASALLYGRIAGALPHDPEVKAHHLGLVACVDASVGRMVPPPTPELLAEDPLLVVAEPYAELPIDGDAWLGPVPNIPGLLPKRSFTGYVARKLFTHNGGHALLAYEGYLKGHEYIWQAAEDPELVAELRGFWEETGTALVRAYGFDEAEQRWHQDDLLRRFCNRALGDTVVRVGRDPARKLRREDRLIGAGLFCLAQGIEPRHVARATAAALRFDYPGDPSATRVRETVDGEGISATLALLMGGDTAAVDDRLIRHIIAAYSGASRDG